MLIKLSTTKSVRETAATLRSAALANHFGVLQVHDLQQTLASNGAELRRECLILEVCQPQQASAILDDNMSVSTALPIRISVFREHGVTVLATLQPTTLLGMFNAPPVFEVARAVEDAVVKILKETVVA